MFKPLLRTLPSTTGNISLNCEVNNFYKTESNVWESNIQTSSIMPLQNKFCNNINSVSLLNDKWEQIVKTFYGNYRNIFYEDNFEYNKKDYVYFDDSNMPLLRNTDYEFGCKRISYSKTGYQFNFFAPIYCTDINDLADYFEIHININDRITKKIKINIGNITTTNYLQVFLQRYLNKVNDDAVYLLQQSKQATYYGIDVVNGGLVQIKDNVIGHIYNNQNTINNFDNIINDGFKRNKLIMQQIIPLSFSFNIDDILTDDEMLKYYFTNAVKITGYYIKENNKCDFYDFSTDYVKFNPIVYNADKNTGNMVIKNSQNNVMDVSYPSLNEAYYSKYRLTNKLTPRYNRWKLKYSSDNYPYITNMSFGFSYIGNSNYNYGGFPVIENSLKPIADIYKHDLQYNNKSESFIRAKNNHISTWYTTIPNSETPETDIKKIAENAFADVIDNKVYYNGILYDLSSSYDKNLDEFAVFVMPSTSITDIDNTIYSENTIDLSYVNNATITSSIESSYTSMFVDSNQHNVKITNSDFFTYNNTGDGKYIEFKDADKYNTFYSIDELRNILGDDIDNVISYDSTNIIDIKANEISQNTFANSSRLLDIYNVDNILTNRNNGLSVLQYGGIDTTKIQISLNTTSTKDLYNENILKNSKSADYYSFFETTSFISTYTFIKYFYNTDNISYFENNVLNSLNKYKYIPYKLQDIIDNDTETSIVNTQYFEQLKDEDINSVYIDSYGLDKANKLNILNANYIKLPYTDNYGMLTSIESLQLWYKNIFKDFVDLNENMNDINKLMFYDKNDSLNSVSSYLYTKKRYVVSTKFGIYIRDKYTTLYDYLQTVKYKNISVSNFFNAISYDDVSHSFIISELDDEINKIFKNNNIKLYYKSRFYKLTTELLNLFIKYDYSLLLYRHDNNQYNDKTLFNTVIADNLNDYKTIYNALIPICDSIKKDDKNSNTLLNYYINDNIIFENNGYYEYNIYDVENMINKQLYENLFTNKPLYGKTLYGKPLYVKTYDIVTPINTKLYESADSVNGLNVFTHNNKYFGYYLIQENFINTNSAFNINTETLSSKIFKHINGKELNDETIYNNFNDLSCLLNIPIFSNFISYVTGIIVKPTAFDISLYYRQSVLDNGNTNDSYKYNSFFIDDDINRNIYNIAFMGNSHNPKIKLNRYCDKIIPYIPKTCLLNNQYFLKCKDVNNSISEDNLYCVPISSIYNQPNPFIISDFNKTTNTDIISTNNHKVYERKYYNASTVFNCIPTISIELKTQYDVDKLAELETQEQTYEIFKKYLNNFLKLGLNDESQILFLYKKYNVTYNINPQGLTLNNKMYTLTYKFTLI